MRSAHAISPWHTIHRVPIDDGNTSAWHFDFHPRRTFGAEIDAMKDGRGMHNKCVAALSCRSPAGAATT